jgi:indolepyruvate ferredoxin oxidoreductase alpha subunit
LGISNIRIVDPENIKETRKIVKEELLREGPSVIISRGPCVLLKSNKTARRAPLQVIPEKCTGCKVCLGLGCPPISWKKGEPNNGDKKQDGFAQIDPNMCSGCTVCKQLCAAGAIIEKED